MRVRVFWETVAPRPRTPIAIVSDARAYAFAPPVANVQLQTDATGRLAAENEVRLSVRRSTGWSGACTIRLEPATNMHSAENAVVRLLDESRRGINTKSGSLFEQRPFDGGGPISWSSFSGSREGEAVWGACVVRRYDQMHRAVTLCCPDVSADPLAWAANRHLLRSLMSGEFSSGGAKRQSDGA
jgi:hypothetical protein